MARSISIAGIGWPYVVLLLASVGRAVFALLDLAFAAWRLTLISLAYACGAPGKSDREHAGSMAFMMSSCLFRESGSAMRSR